LLFVTIMEIMVSLRTRWALRQGERMMGVVCCDGEAIGAEKASGTEFEELSGGVELRW
jgi:hypothetical protein